MIRDLEVKFKSMQIVAFETRKSKRTELPFHLNIKKEDLQERIYEGKKLKNVKVIFEVKINDSRLFYSYKMGRSLKDFNIIFDQANLELVLTESDKEKIKRETKEYLNQELLLENYFK